MGQRVSRLELGERPREELLLLFAERALTVTDELVRDLEVVERFEPIAEPVLRHAAQVEVASAHRAIHARGTRLEVDEPDSGRIEPSLLVRLFGTTHLGRGRGTG